MTRIHRIRIEEVLVHLGIDDEGLLGRLREEGLFEADVLDSYEADELRIAALMIEELGLTPAGVHVALHLRRRLIELESRTATLVSRLNRSEEGAGNEPPA